MPSLSRRKQYTLQHDRTSNGSATLPTVSGGNSKRKSIRKRIGRSVKEKSPRSRRRKVNTIHDQRHPLIATDSMVLHELIPSIPMPGERELNALFAQIVDELGLNREIMLKLPPEKKWQLYLSRHQEQHSGLELDTMRPQFYMEELLHLNEIVYSATMEEVDFESNIKVAKDLKTALRTQPVSFVLQFIDLNGLEYLLDFLRRMSPPIRQSQLHFIIVGCIKAVMNNADGRAHVLAHPTGITVIGQSLKTTNLKTKVLTFEILGALCLVPGGHKKVLNAMMQFQHFACERTRFETLVVDLAHSLDEDQEATHLQVAIMSFLNALINYKAGEESLEFRLHLRHEFMMLGIHPIIIRLRQLNISQLNKHLDIFEFLRVEDEKELAARLHVMERIDYTNAVKMTDVLQRKTAYTGAYVHLISLLYHCLLLPVDDPHYDKYWRLIDRMVQQAVIQQDHGIDPDASPLPINIHKLVLHLLHEDEQRTLIKQMEDIKRAQEHMILRLKKMEWECERTTMERDAHRSTAEKLRTQLDTKLQIIGKLKEKELDMEGQVAKTTKQVNELKIRCDQLEVRLKEKNVDISDLKKEIPVVAPPPPPPPPPPPAPAPPPPPPPPLNMKDAPPPLSKAPNALPSGFVTLRRPLKKTPKPSTTMKSLHWDLIKEPQIRDSFWASVDESTMYDKLNLEEFEKAFYQKPYQDISKFGTLPRGNNKILKEKTFIDTHRAQNCSILLTRLKMTNEQIRHTIITMDKENRIGKDMVEQLLKFVPGEDDKAALVEHLEEVDTFSRADKFMLEMSHIKHYKERLQTLHFIKTFNERMTDIRPSIEDITASCNELTMSSKLRRMLEVVLAFGNYMNRGNRGNAYGFKLSSLNKMVDTKATTETDMNLLHYLIQTLEAKFPEVLTLEVDLPHVRKAARIDLAELEAEFQAIKKELESLKKELDYHRTNPSGDESEHFVSAVEDFAFHAAISVRETDHLLKLMREQFHKALIYFGEDPKAKDQSTNKLLGTFDKFLKSFSESHIELITMRKKKEEEKKRKKGEEQRKMDTLKRKKAREQNRLSNVVGDYSSEGGNFEELIAKLTSGDAFSFGQGIKRGKRHSSNAALVHAWNQVSRDRIELSEAEETKHKHVSRDQIDLTKVEETKHKHVSRDQIDLTKVEETKHNHVGRDQVELTKVEETKHNHVGRDQIGSVEAKDEQKSN